MRSFRVSTVDDDETTKVGDSRSLAPDPRSRPIARKPIPATSIDGVDEHQAGPPAAMKSGHSPVKTSLGARGPLSRFRSYPTVRYRHKFAVLALTSADGLAAWCRKK